MRSYFSFFSARIFFTLCVITSSGIGNDGNFEFITKEVEWGTPINLADFAAPHIEVFVRNREVSYVTAQTADYTRMVPIARTNIQSVEVNNFTNTATVYGSTGLDMQPTKNTRNIEKKKGTDFAGTNSVMYLLYQEPSSGIRVYFLDAIAKQNHDFVVIAVPKPFKAENSAQNMPPVLVTTLANQAREQKQNGQPISPELFTWYVALQKERETLDTSNSEAVTKFNLHAAAYHEALANARNHQQR